MPLKIDNIVFSDLKEKDLLRNLEGGRLAGELKMTSNKQMTKKVTAAGLLVHLHQQRDGVCVPSPREHQLPYSVITTPCTVV